MKIFKGENKKVYVVGDQGETPCEVMAAAKKRFKVNEKCLFQKHGWVKGDDLYDQAVEGAKVVWFVGMNRKVV